MKRLLVCAVIAACSNPAPPATIAPVLAPAATKSRVETRSFHSDALGVDKSVVVYLPADYDAHSARHYPVFYYLHGLGGDETNWAGTGHLDVAADALGLDAIVVMVDGDDSFYVDSVTPIDYDACMADGTGLFFSERPHKATCVRKGDYETYVTRDVVGWTDRTYRTLPTRAGRGIAGLSMGGYGAWMLAMRHADLFSAAASHSGVVALLYAGPHPYVAGQGKRIENLATWKNEAGAIGEWIHSRFGDDLANWSAHDPSALLDKLAPGQLALYLDCGTEDDFRLNDSASYVHDLLVAKHYDHTFFLGPGHHDFRFWSARVPESLKFLRDHLAKPAG